MSNGAAAPDRARLAWRVESLNVLIQSHAGGLDLVDVSFDGVVSVRYTGMCAGCDYRPLTTAGTVEPALMDVPGVTRVHVVGARVSDDALARIAETLESSGASTRAIQLVRRMEAERSRAPTEPL